MGKRTIKDELSIRYGKFEAAATGRLAIKTLGFIALLIVTGVGLWLRFH